MESKLRFFAYARKSSDDKTGKRQVLSLDAQTREIRELARRDHLTVVDFIEESKTAKEPGRPLFNAMLERIERGEANGILLWDIDRLYRNPFDEGRVRWMLQRGIIVSIRTPTRSYSPEDAGLLIAVEGGRATDFIIHHRRNVKRGRDEKLLRGEWPGARPIGFIYDHDKRNIVPDPKRAKYVQTIFEEVAAGTRGLVWVSDRLASFGIKNRSGKQWSKSQCHSFLTNRLYMGIMDWNGETYEGKFKPIVTPELFEKVQKSLKIRSKPRKVRNGHNFPFCGVFRCTCGSMFTAQWAKGNGGMYRYYRCTRKSGVCDEPYIQEKLVIGQCQEALKPLAVTAADANAIRAEIDQAMERDGQELESVANEINSKLQGVQEKLNKLTRGYLDEVIDRESYDAMKSDLIVEKTALKREKERISKTRSFHWIEPAKEFVNALETAGKLQSVESPEEMSELVRKVGTNRLIRSKKVSFSLCEEYAFAASLLGNLTGSASENHSLHGSVDGGSIKWCPRQDLNLYDVTH